MGTTWPTFSLFWGVRWAVGATIAVAIAKTPEPRRPDVPKPLKKITVVKSFQELKNIGFGVPRARIWGHLGGRWSAFGPPGRHLGSIFSGRRAIRKNDRKKVTRVIRTIPEPGGPPALRTNLPDPPSGLSGTTGDCSTPLRAARARWRIYIYIYIISNI